ncbi:MAG: hypothetical protein KDA51_07690, partial [Planctomycetales bacterium]|nr:hypothetical protein [Planctomycetales bacterium]
MTAFIPRAAWLNLCYLLTLGVWASGSVSAQVGKDEANTPTAERRATLTKVAVADQENTPPTERRATLKKDSAKSKGVSPSPFGGLGLPALDGAAAG